MPIGKCGWEIKDPNTCNHCECTVIDKIECMDESPEGRVTPLDENMLNKEGDNHEM